VGGPLTGPSTAVGAALEQVRRGLGGSSTSSRVTVGVVVAALDTASLVPGGRRLRRTGARSDRVHTPQEPTTVATARPAASRLQRTHLTSISQLNSRHFVANRFMMKIFHTNNMQIIEFCCEQFNLILPSRQIANRHDKFIKSESQRTNLLTFINM